MIHGYKLLVLHLLSLTLISCESHLYAVTELLWD